MQQLTYQERITRNMIFLPQGTIHCHQLEPPQKATCTTDRSHLSCATLAFPIWQCPSPDPKNLQKSPAIPLP